MQNDQTHSNICHFHRAFLTFCPDMSYIRTEIEFFSINYIGHHRKNHSKCPISTIFTVQTSTNGVDTLS